MHASSSVRNSHRSVRFLGFVDSVGTAFEAPTLATGLGSYIAQVYTCVEDYHWFYVCVYKIMRSSSLS